MEHDRKLVIKLVRSSPSLLFLHLSACFDPDYDCSKINILFPEGAGETRVVSARSVPSLSRSPQRTVPRGLFPKSQEWRLRPKETSLVASKVSCCHADLCCSLQGAGIRYRF